MHEETGGSPKIKKIIAIGAGKGGVGKSTLTVNLAFALVNMGYKVGILDADLYGPSIGKMVKADIIPIQYENWILPAKGAGIELMSLSYFQAGLNANVVRAPIANGIIKQFLHEVKWGELDFLLIDLPPGTSDIHLTILQEIQVAAALLVSTPQEIALLDVRKAAQMFLKLGVPILGVVENMSYLKLDDKIIYPFGKSSLNHLKSEYGIKKLVEIPIVEELSLCGDIGENCQINNEGLKEIFENLVVQMSHLLESFATLPDLKLVWDKEFSVL
jgi:ATP-binding protein involved in chromosome partitioning